MNTQRFSASSNPSTWFQYFGISAPEDYRWSAAVQMLLGTSHWGGCTLSEVHRVGQQLADKVGNDEAWVSEWVAAGDRARVLAETEETGGRGLTAAGAYLRACCYYQLGERFANPKDAASDAAYRTSVDCFHKFAGLTDGPKIEAVEIEFKDGTLPAYLVDTTDASSTDTAPAMVFFDGLDISKELQYCLGVPELSRRGIKVLIVDGPGNGEAIRFCGHYLRHDYEVAGSAAYDFLAAHPDVDADRIGVMAISLGGYYASRCASCEPRFAACVAWGAIWDYHATWQHRLDAAFKLSLSVPGDHIAWVLGVDTVDEAMKKLEDFRLAPVIGNLHCPFLVTHGEGDAQIPLEDAKRLFDGAESSNKELRIFTTEEGGAQHCQIDHSVKGISYIADWLQATLRS